MIPVIIFFGHLIFLAWAFSKSYQNDGLVQAFLNVFFIVILFTVGWTLSDLVVGLFINAGGYEIAIPDSKTAQFFLKITGFVRIYGNGFGKLIPKDSISLVVLTIIEYFFYRFYFRRTSLK